jgi:hypothetical protein
MAKIGVENINLEQAMPKASRSTSARNLDTHHSFLTHM